MQSVFFYDLFLHYKAFKTNLKFGIDLIESRFSLFPLLY